MAISTTFSYQRSLFSFKKHDILKELRDLSVVRINTFCQTKKPLNCIGCRGNEFTINIPGKRARGLIHFLSHLVSLLSRYQNVDCVLLLRWEIDISAFLDEQPQPYQN